MNSTPSSYADNPELFGQFHRLQAAFVAALSRHPDVIRRWLQSKPPRADGAVDAGKASRSWRTARLSSHRRRRLCELLGQVEADGSQRGALAAWLLASMPVSSFFEMGDTAGPGFAQLDPDAASCANQLIALRNRIFHANYGLAKLAAYRARPTEFEDCLSAASSGLLDAIDRYVPGEQAARFGYFATYWIKYHIGRRAQKQASLVAFPINQHRIARRIERYVCDRANGGLPAPSDRDIRAQLDLGAEAYYWHLHQPQVVSLHSPADSESSGSGFENTLRDPAPPPSYGLDGLEVADRVRGWLRRHVPPATRVMLAYGHGVGALGDAALDYVDHQREIARERLRG